MKDIWKITKFEFNKLVKSKSYIVSLIIMAVIMIAMGLIFSYIAKSNIEDNVDPETGEAIEDEIGIISESFTSEELADLYPGYSQFDDEDQLKDAIEAEEVDYGLVIKDPYDVKIIERRMGISTDNPTEPIRRYLLNQKLSEEGGLSLDDIEEIKSSIVINTETEALKKTNVAIMAISFIITIIMYMLILITGQVIATSVAREKADRTMELLLTSTKPRNLIHGKVLAGFFSSLIVMAVLALSSLVSVAIVMANIASSLDAATLASFGIEEGMVEQVASFDPAVLGKAVTTAIDPTIILTVLVFFLTGYVLYLYMFAALGATVSKLEDLGQALSPVTIIILLVYFATFYTISTPDSGLATVLSYIPFSSVFVAYFRYANSAMSTGQLAISYLILLVTTLVIAKLSVKLYRLSSLNYGNKGLKSQLKGLFTRE